MVTILTAGVAVADFIFHLDEMPRTAEKYRAAESVVAGGGCAANAAVAITRNGGRAMLSARLGDDLIGDLIIADLAKEGVDTTLVDRAPGGRSSYSSVYVDGKGERQIVSFRGSGLAEEPVWPDSFEGLDAVLTDSRWPPLTKKALRLASELSIPGIVDAEAPVTLDLLDGATHVAFSQQGIRSCSGLADHLEALEWVAERLDAWVCVTAGADGVYHVENGATHHTPAIPVRVVDTLGAGDIWHGAFALRLAEGAGERVAIEFANAAGALKCTRFGGRLACPTRNETENFLAEYRRCN